MITARELKKNASGTEKKIMPILVIAMGLFLTGRSLTAQVKVYEEPLTLPTYGLKDAEIMPDWELYRYPYPMYDRLTNQRGERTYKALYVENDYVKALVLPELGGRLHGAEDKTNGYQFLYNQKVIKPALIGITGAWISGGVEWNFPIGHRPTGFRDVDYTTEVNPDSSKTVWVGETDRGTGMRWSVGVTVHPGRNWVETKVRLYNCTPYVQRYQYWATSAVRATWNYKAVIPGEIMTGHGKKEFYHWPISHGIDISYWKNNPAAGSKFVVNSQSDFFGGYSPEEDAGMVHFADHNIVRGKKLWTWGTAPSGRLWEKILTDGDLPYYEPQAGAYSDNQPSLFWIKPGETKIFSHFWFPVRDIGIYDYANLEGALSLSLDNDTIHFGWSPTGENKHATILLTSGGKEIFRKVTDAGPATPFVGEITSGPTDLYKLRMSVISRDGDTLLSYRHVKPTDPPLPVPDPEPAAPGEMASQDLLFVTGEHYNKYGQPALAKSYYEEALKRDPGDVRCNTALGELALKKGMPAEAVRYFNRSVDRDETFFRAYYFKGLAEISEGKCDEAVKSLNRASYDLTWYAASHYELAQLCLKMNRTKKAMEHINRSIQGNGDNIKADDVKALILLKSGRYNEALETVQDNEVTDPLDFFAKAIEMKALQLSDPGKAEKAEKELKALTRGDGDNHIDLAGDFAHSGFYEAATGILDMVSPDHLSPMVTYYKAFYDHLAGNEAMADSLLQTASQLDPRYCFPNRPESFPVLEWAVEQHPDDALAHYLYGDLLRSRNRNEEALAEWKKSVTLNDGNAIAWRNIAQILHQDGSLQKAKQAYLAALKADPHAGKALVELGWLNMEMGVPIDEQIRFFEKNKKLVSEYNQAITELIQLYVVAGRYNDAIDQLKNNHFNSWEGQYGIHQYWIQSNLKQGDIEFARKRYKKALDYYQEALTYPLNLEVAEQPNAVHARNYFKIASALQALGKNDQAQEYFRKIITDRVPDGNANQYYIALAYQELGKKEKASEMLNTMLNALDHESDPQLIADDHAGGMKNSSSAEAVQLYCRSLALEGLGRKNEAERTKEQALDLDPFAEIRAFKAIRSE